MDKNRSNRLSNAAKKRRSSILKSQRPPRTPFSELEFNIATPGDKSRRVSFSRRTDVAEFVTHEATTTWKSIYVEHNKSDSLGNESDVHPKGSAVIVSQNVRIFENQFQEIETDCVNTFGNPKSLIQINSTYNDINLTNQINLEQSTDEVKIKAPTQNFELSYFTEKASKVFGSESINPNFGETSGRIDIDFSDIQTIVTDRPVKDDLDEITDDLGRVDNNLLGGPFRGRNVSQYIEVDLDMTHRPNEQSDMSITDTITDPKVQEVSKSISYQETKRNSTLDKDWITDKENIIVNPYVATCESDNFEIKEAPEKVLVFDGKKLKYASIDADLNELVDPTVNKSKSIGSLSNMLVADYDDQPSTSTKIERVVNETHSASVNMSILSNIQVVQDNLDFKKQEFSVLEENTSSKQRMHLSIANKVDIENITPLLQDDNIVPIQQFRDEIQHRKTIEVNMHDDLPNFDSDVPLIVKSSNIKHQPEGLLYSSLDISDCTEPLKSKIFDADMSVTKGVISGFEHPPRRTTIHFDNNDKMGDISVTQGVIGVMSTNTEKRKTILFEPNDIGADISMTQALPGAINTNKDFQVCLENISTSLSTNEIELVSKKNTILFDQEENNGDISMTQCIINKNCIEASGRKSIYANQDMSVTEAAVHKRMPVELLEGNKCHKNTIIFDQADNNKDISMTQCITNKSSVEAAGRKSIYANQDMSVTEGVINKIIPVELLEDNICHDVSPEIRIKNVLPFHDQNNIRKSLNQLQLANNKPQLQRKTIILNVDDDLPNFVSEEATNCNVTRQYTASENLVLVENVDASKSKIFDGDMSVTKALLGRIEPRRTTIHFDNDDAMADISVTQAVKGIINTHNEKRKTIIFESCDIGADISMTNALPAAININKHFQNTDAVAKKLFIDDEFSQNTDNCMSKTFQDPRKNLTDNDCNLQTTKKHTIYYDKNDTLADISVTKPILGLIETKESKTRPTVIFESSNIGVDMSITQAEAVTKITTDKIESCLRRNTINFDKDDTMADISVTKTIIGFIEAEETETYQKLIHESSHIGADMSMTPMKVVSKTTGKTENSLKNNTIHFDKDDIIAGISVTNPIITHNETNKRDTVIFESSNIKADISTTQVKVVTKNSRDGIESGSRRNIINVDNNDAMPELTLSEPVINLIEPNIIEVRKSIIFESSDFGADISMTPALPVKTDISNDSRKSFNITKNINEFANETQSSAVHVNKTNIQKMCNESTLEKNEIFISNNEINTTTTVFTNSENVDISISQCEPNVNVNTNPPQIKPNNLENSGLDKEDSQSFLSDSFIEKVDNSLTTDFRNELSKAQDFIKETETNKSLHLSNFHVTNPYKIQTLVLNVNENSPSNFRQEENLQLSQNIDVKQLQKDATQSNITLVTADLHQYEENLDISMTEIKDKPDTEKNEIFNESDIDADVSMTQAVEPTFSAQNQDTTAMLNNISLAHAILRKSGINFDNTVDDSMEPSHEEFPQPRKISIRDSNDVARTLQFDKDIEETEQIDIDSDLKLTPLKKAAIADLSVIKDSNKSIVIPPYIIDADNIKELMNDLVKPMADVPCEIINEEVKSVDINVQANLNASSQIDMDIDLNKIKSAAKTNSPKKAKKEKRRHTTFVSSKKVLTFDHTNPLNNISLPSLGNIKAHKYNPISIEDKTSIEIKTNDNILLESVKENIIVIEDEAELKIIKESLAYSKGVENTKIKETEVNTVIIMKNNKELLAEASLTEINDEIVDTNKVNKTDKCIKTNENEEKLEVTSRKRNYSPTKYEPTEHIKVDITPKPQIKILRKSNSPLNVKSPEKTLTICVDNEKCVKFDENNSLIEIKDRKKVNQSITTELIKECYGVNKMDDKSKNIVMGSLKQSQIEAKSQTVEVVSVKEEEANNEEDVSMIEDGEKSVQDTDCDYYMPQESELVHTVKKMPFMGSKMCEWESETPSSWCFLLFHSRLRLTISFNKLNLEVTHDTFVRDIGLEIVKEGFNPVAVYPEAVLTVPRELLKAQTSTVFDINYTFSFVHDENPVAYQCIQVAYRCISHHIKVSGLVSASEIPGLLKRIVVTLYQTKRWGQVMEDCRLRLAYTFTPDGYVMLKVANTQLRTVWEVMIQTDVTLHPIARAIRVKCLLTKQEVREGEIGKVVGKIPEDWGHVPNTLWKIFRHLKNKTKSDSHLLGF